MLGQYDARFPYVGMLISEEKQNLDSQRCRSSRPVSMAWIRWDLSFEHRCYPSRKLEEVGCWKKIIPLIFKDGFKNMQSATGLGAKVPRQGAI